MNPSDISPCARGGIYCTKAFRACTFIGARVNFCERRMERARSVISDSDLRSMAAGRKGGRARERKRRVGGGRDEGIESNRADGRERNFFGRTAAAEQRTRDIKEEFLKPHVAPAREKEWEEGKTGRERERRGEDPRLIQGLDIHATCRSGTFPKILSPLRQFHLFLNHNRKAFDINLRKQDFRKIKRKKFTFF